MFRRPVPPTCSTNEERARVLRTSSSALRSALSARLSPQQKRWLSQLRHGELNFLTAVTKSGRGGASPVQSLSVREKDTVTFDARVELVVSLGTVQGTLTDAGVEFVELPRLSLFRPVLVARSDDAARVLAALGGLSHDEGWRIEPLDVRGARLRERTAARRSNAIGTILCRRRVHAPNGRRLSTTAGAIAIELWEELPRGSANADGSSYPPGTLHRRQRRRDSLVEYLPPEVWRRAIDSCDSRVQLPAPHIRSVTEPIDLVYTWVDGTDPEWRARMVAARTDVDPVAVDESATDESRFASRDELKFSLRSVEYYASWFNHIYLVTDGHVPDWLDLNHPKLTLIDHKDIFTDPTVLPVFNSHAIESQLHHIAGLTERYVYLNDDVFFMRPTDPELFFEGNGIAKFFPSIVPLDIRTVSDGDLPVMTAAKRGREYLVARRHRFVTHRFKHTPHTQVRNVLEEMEADDPELFRSVAASKFRHVDDVSITSSLHHFEAYVRGKAVAGKLSYQFIDLANSDLGLRLDRARRRQDLDVLCLNETSVPRHAVNSIDAEVRAFLSERFPVASSFERDTKAAGKADA